jgi:hypothetical protein
MKTKRRLASGRRMNINVNLTPEVHAALGMICAGNRSAAIEMLVAEYVQREAQRQARRQRALQLQQSYAAAP